MPDTAALDPLLDRLGDVVLTHEYWVQEHVWASGIMARVSGAYWLPELDARLPFPIPPAFRHFLNTREFLAFEAGGIAFFPNTPREPDTFAHALFEDPIISKVTLASGFLQVGRPDTGSYDPICLAVRESQAPLVTLDHEEILVRGRIKSSPLYPSFVTFLQGLVRA
jgi:hypothetical protein